MSDPKIGEVENWNNPPEYIEPPRTWRNSRFAKLTHKFIGISKDYYLTPGGTEGDVSWTYSDSITSLVLNPTIDLIYKRDDNGRYRLMSADVLYSSKTCPDCKGSGIYIGFTDRRTCPTCDGNRVV